MFFPTSLNESFWELCEKTSFSQDFSAVQMNETYNREKIKCLHLSVSAEA
jgi:hypothetical protein